MSGLYASYVAGLPFLSWTLLGDLFYTFGLFGIYALVVKQSRPETKLSLKHASKTQPAL
jgi:hypothetical protein